MAGDVKLKIDGDASGLISAVKAAMAQIESESKKMKLSPEATKNAPNRTPEVSSFLKSNQEAHQQLQNGRNEQNNLRTTNLLLKEKTREYDAISKSIKDRVQQEKDVTSQLNQQAKVENQILGYKRQKENLEEKIAKRAMNDARSYKELLSTMGKGFQSGGMSGVKQAWQGMSATEKIGFGATSIGGLMMAAGTAMDYAGRRPIDIARMQGSAISMTTGRQLGEARTGEYTYESMYGGDRKKAQEQAATSRSLGTGADWTKLVGGGIALAGGIAAIAAALPTGGMSLAALPALATSGAALSGAAAVAGGMAGISSGMKVLDPQKYAAYRSQQEAQDFTTMLAAQHEMGPYRKDAIERLKATAGRDLSIQRSLGLNDIGYYGKNGKGGYLQNQMDLGFTDEMVTKSSQGILGAGGSTAMALQSGTSLQAERGLGLTNADQLMGQLSGTQSIPETSKKALIDIFARGFDTSKYAEENRKYMQAVTDQVYKGGSTSTDTTSAIAEMMRSTVTGTPTSRNIEAGKSAFEAFQSAGTATSGYLGGINIASAMQDPAFRKIKDPAELQALLKLKINEIDETDEDFVGSAKKMGLTGPELAKKLRDRQVKNLKTAVGDRTGMSERGVISTLIPGLGAPEQKAFANLINQEPSPEKDAAIVKLTKEAETKMTSKDTDRAGDTMVQASAKNAQISLETLSSSINKFAEDAMVAAKKLGAEAPVGRVNEAAQVAREAAYAVSKTVWNPKTHQMESTGQQYDRIQKQGN